MEVDEDFATSTSILALHRSKSGMHTQIFFNHYWQIWTSYNV